MMLELNYPREECDTCPSWLSAVQQCSGSGVTLSLVSVVSSQLISPTLQQWRLTTISTNTSITSTFNFRGVLYITVYHLKIVTVRDSDYARSVIVSLLDSSSRFYGRNRNI